MFFDFLKSLVDPKFLGSREFTEASPLIFLGLLVFLYCLPGICNGIREEIIYQRQKRTCR